MTKIKLCILLSCLVYWLVIPCGAHGQTLCPPGTFSVPNDSVTGTTAFTLTKINASGNAVIMATTDTTGYAGVAILNPGKFGSVCLANNGLWPLTVDGTTTAQHYILISNTVGGDGKDSTASTPPISGGDIIGRVQQASTGAASVSMVNLFPPEVLATNPTGAVLGPGSSTAKDIPVYNDASGVVLADPTGAQVVNSTLHASNTFFGAAFSTVSISPVTVATSPTIAINQQVGFHCEGQWSWAGTGAGHNEMQVNASQAPQSIWYTLENWTSQTATKAVPSNTNANLIDGGTGAAGANYKWSLDGYVQWNASTPGTFTLQAATNVGTATLAYPQGAYCTIHP